MGATQGRRTVAAIISQMARTQTKNFKKITKTFREQIAIVSPFENFKIKECGSYPKKKAFKGWWGIGRRTPSWPLKYEKNNELSKKWALPKGGAQ